MPKICSYCQEPVWMLSGGEEKCNCTIEALRADLKHAQNNAANLELERDDMAARVGILRGRLIDIRDAAPSLWARTEAANALEYDHNSANPSTASRLRDDIYEECARIAIDRHERWGTAYQSYVSGWQAACCQIAIDIRARKSR